MAKNKQQPSIFAPGPTVYIGESYEDALERRKYEDDLERRKRERAEASKVKPFKALRSDSERNPLVAEYRKIRAKYLSVTAVTAILVSALLLFLILGVTPEFAINHPIVLYLVSITWVVTISFVSVLYPLIIGEKKRAGYRNVYVFRTGLLQKRHPELFNAWWDFENEIPDNAIRIPRDFEPIHRPVAPSTPKGAIYRTPKRSNNL